MEIKRLSISLANFQIVEEIACFVIINIKMWVSSLCHQQNRQLAILVSHSVSVIGSLVAATILNNDIKQMSDHY